LSFSSLPRRPAGADVFCLPKAASASSVHQFDGEQMANAALIIEVGRSRNVPPRGWLIAISAALQESSLRNVPPGDRDSAGLLAPLHLLQQLLDGEAVVLYRNLPPARVKLRRWFADRDLKRLAAMPNSGAEVSLDDCVPIAATADVVTASGMRHQRSDR